MSTFTRLKVSKTRSSKPMARVFQMKMRKFLPKVKQIKINVEKTKLWWLLWVTLQLKIYSGGSYLTKARKVL